MNRKSCFQKLVYTFPTLLMSSQIPVLTHSQTDIAWRTKLCKDMNLAKIMETMCKNT